MPRVRWTQTLEGYSVYYGGAIIKDMITILSPERAAEAVKSGLAVELKETDEAPAAAKRRKRKEG